MEQSEFIDRLTKILSKKGLKFLFFDKNQEYGDPLVITDWDKDEDLEDLNEEEDSLI